MSIALLEKTPFGVTVKTLDVRGGKSVEDVADQAKAAFIGRALIEWWSNGDLSRHGGQNWWMVNFTPPPGMGAGTAYDLRQILGKALIQDHRISITAGLLKTDTNHVPVVAFDAMEKAEHIGRDMIAWWANPGRSRWFLSPLKFKSGRGVPLDVRIQVNQHMAGYEVERERLGRAGKIPSGR